jgi:DNA-binding NtrC family response regulator
MIRLACYTEDSKLHPLLSSALGSNYSLIAESSRLRLRKLITEDQVDVLILDLDSESRPAEDSIALFNELAGPRVPVVVMADDSRRSVALDLLQRGAYDHFRKPPSLVELRVVVGRAYERVVLKRELEKTQATLRASAGCDGLVGSSGRSQVVYDMIRRVADLNAHVLIRGESGTGKELIARAIHSLSKRAAAPFVAVPCGAIPETLMEAELFGHEKGAFTGTTGPREGYLAMSGEGTLLLDEIGELSLQTQVKLLRVLQQKEYSRLGSNKLIPLRARILFATHRRLEQMVAERTFREDLFFRLNVVTIEAPPLRERTEDVPTLARHFLRQYAGAFGRPVSDIAPEAMELLVEYNWPGNVRELENAIQAAVALARTDAIEPEDLPSALRRPMASPALQLCVASGSFEDRLKAYKLRLANEALAKCNGNRTLAARSLNISRAYLHRLIRDPADVNAA